MARRFDPLFCGYLGMLGLPLLLSIGLNADALGRWWHTGTCPGGPMDRQAEACNVFDLLFVTVLGGWVAPIVLSLLAMWCLWWTVVYVVVRWFGARRRRRCHGRG